MLTAAGSPLVGGGHPDTHMATAPKTLRVTVLRPFLLRLRRQEVGQELDIERQLAMELASANKVEILRPDIAAAAAIADMKPPAPAKGKAAKES